MENCLWFDGSDDYAKVNVDDWLGNFTISQWVWANTTNQSNYASTFAIDDNAGSNQSFQHMISGGEWKLTITKPSHLAMLFHKNGAT